VSLPQPLPLFQTTNLGPLTLDGETLRGLEELTRAVYLSDSRPWVIGYSGGKDSTALLQLIWLSLKGLEPEKRLKPVYVISSDTLVESPLIVRQIQTTLDRIKATAEREGMPVYTEIVRPRVDDSFWVNLIGRGYPAPYRRFRWCTDRLKIQPANQFIKDTAQRHGEVVLALGVRRSESATRAQAMSLHRRHGEALSRHSDLTGAWVYTPIENWTTTDVWTYLLNTKSPWGNNNHDLVTMYRNANAGECPLVVDTKTPSCGNSRFGCWVCTVVERDRSMEAMIDNGEEWMQPMLEFRDWLATTQDPERKSTIRDLRRRSGQYSYWGANDEKIIWGPYKFEFRQEILRRLLRAQRAVRDDDERSEFPLITIAELEEIRKLWRTELSDWEDTVPRIWKEETGEDFGWLIDDTPSGSADELALIRDAAQTHDVPPGLMQELIEIERRTTGLHRRTAVYDQINSAFRKDWRTEEEVREELRQRTDEQSNAMSSQHVDTHSLDS
jgi:DNA sulfur modification protein DndC